MNGRRQRRNRALGLVAVLASSVLASSGCIEREGRPVNPCTQVSVAQSIQVTNVDKVDLLFMVDNSNSMGEEQASLAAEFPNMIRVLTYGNYNGMPSADGETDFEPVRDLNVGVITSDMGTGGAAVTTCTRADYGDDGVLRTQGRTDVSGCMATYDSFLNFNSGDDPADFARDVACVAVTGTGGCGFEQQLEAILKAVTPTAAQPWTAPNFVPVGSANAPQGLEAPFFRMTTPHGNVANAGFARQDAVLAIIPVTDEEDCSARDPGLFDPSNPNFPGDLNLRCFAHPTALHHINRYVNGFLQLRARENLLIYAPIVGIPVDLAPAAGQTPDYDRLIGPMGVRDERMLEIPDPTMPTRLTPSCNVPNRGVAFPPVRIVEVARGLQAAGAGVTVQSICQESFNGALTEIIRQIATALGAACLPRPLNLEADGSVDCNVVAAIPPSAGDCDANGYVQQRDDSGNPIFDGERPVCVLTQLTPSDTDVASGTPPSGNGWFYDYFTEEGAANCQVGTDPYQRIAFTQEPPSGSTVRLECFLAVQGTGSGDVQIGTFCDPEGENLCPNGQTSEGTPLACDPVTRACGVPCGTDADCRTAGLIGYVCDDRPLSMVDPGEFAGNNDPYNYCVNPTCS